MNLHLLTLKKGNYNKNNIMRKFILTFGLFIAGSIGCFAQPTLVQGNEKPFSFPKNFNFIGLENKGEAYFIFKSKEFSEIYPTLVVVGNSGNTEHSGEVKFNGGTFTNSTFMHDAVKLGGKVIMLLENRNKTAETNRLIAKTLDNKGNLGTEEKELAAFPYQKILKPGDWYSSITPDGKHLAVIGQLPSEKDELLKFKYFFYDENLTPISSGMFSFPEIKKRMLIESFHASNKGDFYLVENETEKQNRYPVVYKISVGATTGTVIPVTPPEETIKFANYVTAMNPAGELIIGGYIKDKSGTFSTDGFEEKVTGTWMYNATTAKKTINPFSNKIINPKSLGLVFNGSTIFLVGEQLKSTREKPNMQQMQKFEDHYTYEHGDIFVTAFDNEGNKKFDLTMSKKFTARDFHNDLFPAFGILNNKLALVYNDSYGKYLPNTSYDNYKLPVLVYINNDGLMEAPIHFAKELQVTRSTYTLYPALSVSGPNGMIILSANSSNAKGVIIK